MPKEFFTERDIEDMVRRGLLSLQLNENTVLTELAYEKAKSLGMELRREQPVEPPAAPVRPYLSQAHTPGFDAPAPASKEQSDLVDRIRAEAAARLGTQVDPTLLDVIIQRVLKSTGMK